MMQAGVSIAICTYNGKERITKAIISIAAQKEISRELVELIIVDNDSTDGTLEYCKQLINYIDFPFDIQFLQENKPGAVNARNKALSKAKYKWMLICDDDNELDENYLFNAFEILSNNNKIGALGACGIAVFEQQEPEWFKKYCSSYAVEKQNIVNGKIEKYNASLYGAGSFFNAEILKKVYESGFHNIMTGPNKNKLTRGEDTEWCYLLLLHQYEIWYSSNLTFKHYLSTNRLNWKYYLNLKKGIASGAALLFCYHYLLKKNNRNAASFFASYFKQVIFNYALYAKCLVKKNFKNTNQIELGLVISKEKMGSFSKNILLAYSSYKNIIRLLNKSL